MRSEGKLTLKNLSRVKLEVLTWLSRQFSLLYLLKLGTAKEGQKKRRFRICRLRYLAIQNSIKWIIVPLIAPASMTKLRLHPEIHDKNTLQQKQKINFGDFSLKVKQLRYLLFSSQQLPAWVYSYIILEDECWCTLPLLLLYVTAARETNDND